MGDVVGTRINWALRKAVLSAPDDVKHFAGTARCRKCGWEDKLVIPAPLWAAAPAAAPCEQAGCEDLMLFVHADADVPDGQEPYDFFVVLPWDRDE